MTSPSPGTPAATALSSPPRAFVSPAPAPAARKGLGSRGPYRKRLSHKGPYKPLGVTLDSAPGSSLGQPKPPAPVDGAAWQAGVTADNEHYRVFLDGEPQPLAFAASPGQGGREGWVMLYEAKASAGGQPELDDDGVGGAGLLKRVPVTKRGRVELRRTRD